jgi:hypothetical protein
MADEDVVEESADRQLLVVELQKAWKRKHIKGLRKGKGKLLGKIEELVEDLEEEGILGENVQPLVIVVREETDLLGFLRD